MADAGATAFRLNASHLDTDSLTSAIRHLRAVAPGVPIVVDLQGAKMRLGLLAPRTLVTGQRLRFRHGTEARDDDAAGALPIPHAEFFAQVAPGDVLSVDDARVRLEVVETGDGTIDAVALNDAVLLPRKGVNVEQHPVRLSGLAERDRGACAAAADLGVTHFAFSFMLDGGEADWVRALVPGASVTGKIERREATSGLRAITRYVDDLWICRGDLGAQLGASRLAAFVADTRPHDLPIPVLMAGQVLEHLTAHEDPTRSEVCHLYDLVRRGYAGLVLSDETAIGRDPRHAVTVASSLLRAFRA